MIRKFATFIVTSLAILSLPIAATAKNQLGQYQLTWLVFTPTSQGPLGLQSRERKPFATETDCVRFAERMTPRMEDWVRGALRAEWEHEVRVAFKCDLAGEPA